MLLVDAFYYGALMLCWTLQVSHGATGPRVTDTTSTGDGWERRNHVPHSTPCLVDDMFAALRESVGNDGELTNCSLTLFGICALPDNSSALMELAKETNQRNGLEVLHLAGVHVTEEDERGALTMTFDLPQSPLLRLNPVLLLPFESPFAGGNLDATFTSQSLKPHTQPVCISGETRYIMLTGKASEANVHHTWTISAQANSPDMKQSLKDVLIGGNTGSMSPLLVSSGEGGTDTRHTTHVAGSSSFLCELRRFLGDVMPQHHPMSPPLELTSLLSPLLWPPLTLGLASSESLLAGLINSSTLTIFSFASCCSKIQTRLALSPALLEELRQRLMRSVVQIMEVIREEEVGHRTPERLGRLIELSAFPMRGAATGERQYRAFLLLKALQTVARTYEVKRGLRAIRADPNNPVGGGKCGLRGLTVALNGHVTSPLIADINNCHGSCTFPQENPTNHAYLLNAHIERHRAANVYLSERPPCCAPVAYEDMDVVVFNRQMDETTIEPCKEVVVTKCACR